MFTSKRFLVYGRHKPHENAFASSIARRVQHRRNRETFCNMFFVVPTVEFILVFGRHICPRSCLAVYYASSPC